MNLQPRKMSRKAADWWDERLRNALPDGAWRIADSEVDPRTEPSIWRLELPNTSYMAPQAAFWWVSNEKR